MVLREKGKGKWTRTLRPRSRAEAKGRKMVIIMAWMLMWNQRMMEAIKMLKIKWLMKKMTQISNENPTNQLYFIPNPLSKHL
jgi:hypothetical protein